jgi:aspartyl/asparaginyl beta-hydroxylase (cupin superfamily)
MHHGALPEKPLTPGEQRMLEAVPNLVSESVKRRAAAQNVPKEIIDASPASRALG